MSRRRLERNQYLLLRLGALVLDALLFSLALIIPGTLVSVAALWSSADPHTTRLIWMIVGGVLVAALLFRDGFRGRSPGKRVLGLLVSTPARPCGLIRSLIRNLPLFVPGLIVLEALLVVARSDSRRLGDAIAGTAVIEE